MLRVPFTLLLLLAVGLLSNAAQVPQLRNSRRTARLEDADSTDGEVAVVEEVYPTPYPAASYRPGRAFNLPGEGDDAIADEAQQEGSGLATITTETADDVYTSTTEAIEGETTTPYAWVPTDYHVSDDAANHGRSAKAPYPAAGWRPSRAFLLPTEVKTAQEAAAVDAFETSTATPLAPFTTQLSVDESATDSPQQPTLTQPAVSKARKAPYPPAGWRPSRAFLLPTEIDSANQDSGLAVNEPEPPVSPADKAGHPACGVSDNPVAPKPEEGAKENPDAERVYVTANLGPAVLNSPLSVPVLLRSQKLITPPIYVPADHPFAYSAGV